MRHAKREFSLLSGALTLSLGLTLALTACETQSSTSINKGKPGGPGKKATPIVVEPLPSLDRGSQALLLLEELMRARRSSLSLAYEPKQDSQRDCITYDAKRTETEDMRVYLSAVYKCSRDVAATSTEPTGLKVALEGREVFGASKKKPISKMEGKYNRTTTRLSDPTEIAEDAAQSRTVVLTYPQNLTNEAVPQYTLKSTTTHEESLPERRNSGEYWVAAINGIWQEPAEQTLNLAPGSTLGLNYRAPSGTTPSPMSKFEFRAETAIQFSSGSCPRPIGTFSWRFTDGAGKLTQQGLLETSEAGIKDVALGETRDWPSHCLEK